MFDSTGNKIWEKKLSPYPVVYYENTPRVILPLPNGHILVGGFIGTSWQRNTNNGFLFEIDSLGNKLWQQIFDGGYADDAVQAVLIPNSNEMVVLQWQAMFPKNPPSYLNSVYGRVKAYKINWQTHQTMASNYINSGVQGYILSNPIIINDKIVYQYYALNNSWSKVEGIGVINTNLDSLYSTRYLPNTESTSNPNAVPSYNIYGINIMIDGSIITAGWFYTPPTPVLFPQGGQYGWLMRLDSMGCFISGCWVGTEQSVVNDTKIQVFPNPAHSELTIQYPDFNHTQIIISDVLGRPQKTLSLQSETTTISIANLSNGFYYVSMYQNGRLLHSRKLLVLPE
jgi:hypothetical protein